MIATEILAKFKKTKFRLITLGGPLRVAAAKAKRMEKAIEQLMDEREYKVEKWDNFWCKTDWLCTSTPVKKESTIYSEHRIEEPDKIMPGLEKIKQYLISLKNRVNGNCHFIYFENEEVMNLLITGQIQKNVISTHLTL